MMPWAARLSAIPGGHVEQPRGGGGRLLFMRRRNEERADSSVGGCVVHPLLPGEQARELKANIPEVSVVAGKEQE